MHSGKLITTHEYDMIVLIDLNEGPVTKGGDPKTINVVVGLDTASRMNNVGSNIVLDKVVDKNSASGIPNKSVNKSHHVVHIKGEKNSLGKAETVEGSIV